MCFYGQTPALFVDLKQLRRVGRVKLLHVAQLAVYRSRARADELIKLAAAEGIELPDEVLDAVAGGYVYYHSGNLISEMWEVIEDGTGKVLHRNSNKGSAQYMAKQYGQSTDEISRDQLGSIRKNYENSQKKC